MDISIHFQEEPKQDRLSSGMVKISGELYKLPFWGEKLGDQNYLQVQVILVFGGDVGLHGVSSFCLGLDTLANKGARCFPKQYS